MDIRGFILRSLEKGGEVRTRDAMKTFGFSRGDFLAAEGGEMRSD